jgi:hypothetical protein
MAAAGPQIIGEGGAGTDENIILRRETVPQIDPAFHSYAVAQPDPILNEGVITDIAIGTDHYISEHVGKSPNARAGSDNGSWLDECLGMNHFRRWIRVLSCWVSLSRSGWTMSKALVRSPKTAPFATGA